MFPSSLCFQTFYILLSERQHNGLSSYSGKILFMEITWISGNKLEDHVKTSYKCTLLLQSGVGERAASSLVQPTLNFRGIMLETYCIICKGVSNGFLQ
jgi:hypothetical protein